MDALPHDSHVFASALEFFRQRERLTRRLRPTLLVDQTLTFVPVVTPPRPAGQRSQGVPRGR